MLNENNLLTHHVYPVTLINVKEECIVTGHFYGSERFLVGVYKYLSAGHFVFKSKFWKGVILQSYLHNNSWKMT